MTDDPLDRDRHPMRPDHPDFWRLSEIVLENDARAEAGEFEQVVSEVADLPTVIYMSLQRALRVKQQTGVDMGSVWLSQMWIDAFVAGVKFEQRRLPQQRKPSEGL